VLVPAIALIAISCVAKTATGWIASAGLDIEARDLCRSALVADPTAQFALVGGIEPDRDHDRATGRRGLHQLRILERGGAAPIRDRRKSLSVCRPLGSSVRLLPTANLGVEFWPSSRRIR